MYVRMYACIYIYIEYYRMIIGIRFSGGVLFYKLTGSLKVLAG